VLAAKLVLYRGLSWTKLASIPELILLAQLLTYAVVFAVMYGLVATRTGNFWASIRWNRPGSSWIGFLLGGAGLYLVLTGLGQLLPIPRHLPIDRFFDNAREATIMSIFAVTVAPLMEELFFRGFLYPVLARRWGMSASIVLTSAAFGILHGAQLKYSWAVLIIFLVGVALTTVRALTKSVAASFLVHVGYNGTLSLLIYAVTGGFRHLEKLNQ
jgi:membrane protease YdiL (CAAX protease family)